MIALSPTRSVCILGRLTAREEFSLLTQPGLTLIAFLRKNTNYNLGHIVKSLLSFYVNWSLPTKLIIFSTGCYLLKIL